MTMSANSSNGVYADGPIFRQDILAIAPSWHCDAHCAHCFIPVAKRKNDFFRKDVIEAVLSNMPQEIKVVSITGGEPFLHPERLLEIARASAKRKRFTAVVTNGIWFTQMPNGGNLLEKFYRAGLRGISISIDSYHRPQISVEDTVKLLKAARALGMAVNIRGAGRQAEIIAARIKRTGVLKGQENPTQLFGIEHSGCAKKLPQDKMHKKIDHCFEVVKPFVHPDGLVQACCSIRALEIKNDVLNLGNVLKEPLDSILERARRNYLLAALAVFGPGGLVKILGEKIVTRGKSCCQLCLEVLNDRARVKKLKDKISSSHELKKEIAGRMLVWESCYRPELLPQFQTGV